jgi:hypothetical protein
MNVISPRKLPLGKAITGEFCDELTGLLILIRRISQPNNNVVGYQHDENGDYDPADGLNFPTDWFHLILLAYPQKLGLRFAKHQFQATRAIHAAMPNRQDIVLFFTDSRFWSWHPVTTTGTSQVAGFALA